MSQLASELESIKNDWSQLKLNWQDCRSDWNDDNTYQFERIFWQEYENIVPSALQELESLASLIQRAHNEVR
jgi:hypothetical protein